MVGKVGAEQNKYGVELYKNKKGLEYPFTNSRFVVLHLSRHVHTPARPTQAPTALVNALLLLMLVLLSSLI